MSAIRIALPICPLPRSIDRGLIEACFARSVFPRAGDPFRDLLIAASLKLRDARFEGRSLRGALPRSIDRGLIEADRMWHARIHSLASLPRSIDRGLIEAYSA